MRDKKYVSSDLLEIIIDGIQEKKGNDIVSMDLSKLEHAVTKNFIICDAESDRQIVAIANSVEDKVFEKTNQKTWNKQGHSNSEWIILDYVDVVVHIFKKEIRHFYDLEGLWADADRKEIEEESILYAKTEK